MRRPFFNVGIAGIIVLILSTALLFINPSKAGTLPKGFTTPIVAFELAASEQEVYDIFGHEPSAARDLLIAKVDLGNSIDFIYMLAYAAFLFLFSMVCRKISRNGFFLVPAVLSVAVLASDALENVQLLSITSKLAAGNFTHELSLLNVFTWMKWGGLGIILLCFIPFLCKRGLIGKIVSVLTVFCAAAGAAAFVDRSLAMELYCILIGLVFSFLIAFSFIGREKDFSSAS